MDTRADTPDLPVGSCVGPWRILGALGHGGMGTVFHVEHAETRLQAALKLASRELAMNPSLRERFLRETKLAATVQHKNLVACLDSGSDRGNLYLALELVKGGSLQDRIRKGPLPWRDVARFGGQIARALEAIHGAGIVHRDLKPANVLITEDGTAKLTDFGIARAEGEIGLTKTGELVGTVEYMAPEQSGAAFGVDTRVDLYALGCTLHCLAAGQPPFPGTGPQILTKHLRADPPPLRTLVPETAPELERIVLQLLAKDPRERGGSAANVARDLEALAGSRSGARRSGAGLPAVLGVAAVVALLGGGAALLVRSKLKVPAPTAPPAPPKPVPPPTQTPPPAPTRFTPKPDDPFQESKPQWFLALEKAGEKVPSALPEGVFYGKEEKVYWNAKDRSQLVFVPGGDVKLGKPYLYPVASDKNSIDPTIAIDRRGEERGTVAIAPFFLGRYEVSNEQFERYVKATGYKTRVERNEIVWEVCDGVGGGLSVTRADWKDPHGTGVRRSEWLTWPVVQVAWEDASSYLAWADLRFATEYEWECGAAWDGKALRPFPWGEEAPNSDTAEIVQINLDGHGKFAHLVAVDAHPEGRSPWGAFNMCGNVKEWIREEAPGEGRHVVKGGAFMNGLPQLRPNYRGSEHGASNAIGFRVALSAAP